MVQNPPYWNANCALGHPKQSDLNHSSLNLRCFECSSAQFAFQYDGSFAGRSHGFKPGRSHMLGPSQILGGFSLFSRKGIYEINHICI